MCGIAGKIYLDSRKVTSEDLLKCSRKISHRGPDDHGIWISKNEKVGFAHRRLAIIDLSKNGHQPMDYMGRYKLVCNGEIYNYQEIKIHLEKFGYKFKTKSDMEVIMALYDRYKEKCLKHLRGMFSFALYDEKEKVIFAARDRLGKKPFKYYYSNGVFIFASELKSILTNKEVNKQPDYDAINDYLTYGYVPSPKTGFKDIYKLPPGYCLTLNLKTKTLKLKRYWFLDFSEKLNLSENEWSKLILAGLEESVKLRMVSDVEVGAFLSGGVDSSAVVAFMAKNSPKPIKTFTVTFKEKRFDESKYAKKIAKMYATDHIEIPVNPQSIDILPDLVSQYEEPYADASAVITYLVSREARKHLKVILNGDGGDENFAGYDRYVRLKRDFRWNKLRPLFPLLQLGNKTLEKYIHSLKPGIDRKFIGYNSYFSNSDKEKLYDSAELDYLADSNSHDVYLNKFKEAKTDHFRDQALYADVTTYLPEDLLAKVDIASMSVGLEARSPILDHKFVELAAKIPYSLKVGPKNTTKYIFKKSLEGILPGDILYRQKMGFSVPLDMWFTGKLNNYARRKLLARKSHLRHLVNKDFVNEMLNTHSIKNDFGPRLWALLTLELWFESYFS